MVKRNEFSVLQGDCYGQKNTPPEVQKVCTPGGYLFSVDGPNDSLPVIRIYLVGVSSTRRFLARPSFVALEVTGFASPYPTVVRRAGLIPPLLTR